MEHDDTTKYDRYTIENKGEDNQFPFFVYGWTTYGPGSVLAGQPSKCFLDWYETHEEAVTAYPAAQNSNKYLDPQVSLNHLPDEDDPVAGGMYPDDYDSEEEY